MKSLLLLLYLAGAAVAQDITLPPPGPLPKTAEQSALTRDFTTSCEDALYRRACKSYNELITSHDQELMSLFNSPDAYICFRENEDVFYIMSVGTPPPRDFQRVPPSPFYKPPYRGMVVFERFKNGQEDESKIVLGEWTRFGPNSPPHFDTASKDVPTLHVTESEISFYEEFKNIGGGNTRYTVQIRRSTMRASESFEWHNSSADPKKPPDNGTETNSGHCVVF